MLQRSRRAKRALRWGSRAGSWTATCPTATAARGQTGSARRPRWCLRELQRSPPRVPATVARAHPRLLSVRAEVSLGDLAIEVLAVVDDGQRRYRVPLELREIGARWLVTAVGG